MTAMSEAPMTDSSHGELVAHEQTYASFIKLLKYGAVLCFGVAAAVVLILAY
jgi:hypothetical protein